MCRNAPRPKGPSLVSMATLSRRRLGFNRDISQKALGSDAVAIPSTCRRVGKVINGSLLSIYAPGVTCKSIGPKRALSRPAPILAGLEKVRESFKLPKRLILRNQVTFQEARFTRSQPLFHGHVLFAHVLGCEQQAEVS